MAGITTNIGFAVPDHLAPLLQPTPSGVLKLSAAWDGLTVESQILILTTVKAHRFPPPLARQVRLSALQSANPYIRYLAAREFLYGEESEGEATLYPHIRDDPSPLVRSCLFERDLAEFSGQPNYPENFFQLPQEARLAIMRSTCGSGREIAQLVTYALTRQVREGAASEVELFEILCDYVTSPRFKQRYSRTHSDQAFAALLQDDLSCLWDLILQLPEESAQLLIQHLPTLADPENGVPFRILEQLTSEQLCTLLDREDIQLRAFRKHIFFHRSEEEDFLLRGAALRHHFTLTYQEFVDIIKQPVEACESLLEELSRARDLDLCLAEAVHDVLLLSNNYHGARDAKESFQQRFAKVKRQKSERAQQPTELQALLLYRLAKTVVPWETEVDDPPLSADFAFLADLIISRDTWGTFMAFAEAWTCDSQWVRQCEKIFPFLHGAENE